MSRAYRNKIIISLKLSSRYSRSFLYSRMDPSASLNGPSLVVLEAAAACDCRRSAACCSSSSLSMLTVPPGEALLGVPSFPDSGMLLGSVAAMVALAAAIASSADESLSRLEEGASADSPALQH